jgi:hypothetical protein
VFTITLGKRRGVIDAFKYFRLTIELMSMVALSPARNQQLQVQCPLKPPGH